MATFSETFLCTALPESIAGTEVLIAVLISPRLMSDSTTDETLAHWPDVLDWPSIQPTWQVTITQGSKTVPLTGIEVSGPYDGANWGQLFPPGMLNTPYQAKDHDRSATPIFSYPVAKVRDAVRDLYVQAVTSSRTEFPTVEVLQTMPHFADLKKAADPAFVAEVVKSQSKNPVPDASADIAHAIGMGEAAMQGARPGSDPPPPPPSTRPTVTKVDPPSGPSTGGTPVTITGTNFIEVVTVTFNGIAATKINVISDTTITCETPPGPAFTPPDNTIVLVPVPVQVTTRIGGPSDAKDLYSYSYGSHIG